jgi:hypothetical protein
VAALQGEQTMTRRSITWWTAGLATLLCASLLGACALQTRQLEPEVAALSVVQLDRLAITADRAPEGGTSTRLANTAAQARLR